MTTSAENSPMLEMIQRRGKGKMNVKDLRVETGKAYSGLGICVRGNEGVLSANSIGKSAGSTSMLGSAREVLLGERVCEKGFDEEGPPSLPFLERVEEEIENAAGWVSRVLHREVRGAEEGLVLGIRDCEREGWVRGDGSVVGEKGKKTW